MISTSQGCQSGYPSVGLSKSHTLQQPVGKDADEQDISTVNCGKLWICENTLGTLTVHPHSHESWDLPRYYTYGEGRKWNCLYVIWLWFHPRKPIYGIPEKENKIAPTACNTAKNSCFHQIWKHEFNLKWYIIQRFSTYIFSWSY